MHAMATGERGGMACLVCVFWWDFTCLLFGFLVRRGVGSTDACVLRSLLLFGGFLVLVLLLMMFGAAAAILEAPCFFFRKLFLQVQRRLTAAASEMTRGLSPPGF